MNLKLIKYSAERVEESKGKLFRCLGNLRHNGKKILSIGATSKSTTVFNYCGIDDSIVDCITDTTPSKQGLLAVRSHIPVVSRDSVNLNDYDYAFLGAWNFKDVIANKERDFVKNGGKFITHIIARNNDIFIRRMICIIMKMIELRGYLMCLMF